MPLLLKYFTVKNITTNITTADFGVYLLDFVKITANSSISNFIIPTTVSDSVQSQQTVANYTVDYKFSIYNTSSSGEYTSNNLSYINTVNYGLNIS